MQIQTTTAPNALRVLVIFAHPTFESSRINLGLYNAVKDLPNLVWHNLYDTYPNQLVDVAHEQALLESCDVVILQHPLYWYSCPALMKNWLDNVLSVGWAYGENAAALRGKALIQVISSGGSETVYKRGGYNNFTLAELLRPFEQTADLCEMSYHQPFLTQGAGNIEFANIDTQAVQYRAWMSDIIAGKLPPLVNTHHAVQADYLASVLN